VEITEEPDGEGSSRSFYKNCKSAILTRSRGALEEGLRDKWRAGLTEAQIVDAVEIDLLQPDC